MIMEHKEFLLVDIRDKADFAKIHAKGSINVNPRFLPSKAFLKTKNVILLYSGINEPMAISFASEAISEGFRSVRVLEGGITGWVESGNEIEGIPGSQRELYLIDPGELYFVYKKAPWSFLILQLSEHESLIRLFSRSEIIRLMETNEEPSGGGESLEEKLKTARKKSSLPIVVTDADGTMKDKVLLTRSSLRLKQVFYLEGGLKAYNSYVKMMSVSAEGRKHLGERFNKGCE